MDTSNDDKELHGISPDEPQSIGDMPVAVNQPVEETTDDSETPEPIAALVAFESPADNSVILRRAGFQIRSGYLGRPASRAELRFLNSTGSSYQQRSIATTDGGIVYTTDFEMQEGQNSISFRTVFANYWSEWFSTGKFLAVNPPTISTAPGTVFPTTTPTITGTGQAGAKVQLWRNGMPHSSVGYVSGTSGVGTWSLTTYISSEGSLTVSVREEFSGWNGHIDSVAVSFEIKLPVADPFIDDPKPNQIITVPKPTVSGKGHSGAIIRIYEAGSGAILYGSGSVSNGSWSIPLTESLPSRRITLVAGQTFNGVET